MQKGDNPRKATHFIRYLCSIETEIQAKIIYTIYFLAGGSWLFPELHFYSKDVTYSEAFVRHLVVWRGLSEKNLLRVRVLFCNCAFWIVKCHADRIKATEKTKESKILHINNTANICVFKKKKKKRNKRFLWMQFSRLHCYLAGSAAPE